MPEFLAAIGYGGYISPIKLAVFLVLFFGWLPVVNWVYKDAEAVGTKNAYWTAIVFGAWAAGGLVWLLVPVFIIGIAIYLIAAGVASISYVMHRNSLVPRIPASPYHRTHQRTAQQPNQKGRIAEKLHLHHCKQQ